jgi:hypothetical protein
VKQKKREHISLQISNLNRGDNAEEETLVVLIEAW